MYIRIHVVYAYIYLSIIHIYIYVCKYLHTYVCIHIRIHIHTYIHMYTYTYAYIHTYIYTYMCVYIYIYTHITIHTHTHIYIQSIYSKLHILHNLYTYTTLPRWPRAWRRRGRAASSGKSTSSLAPCPRRSARRWGAIDNIGYVCAPNVYWDLTTILPTIVLGRHIFNISNNGDARLRPPFSCALAVTSPVAFERARARRGHGVYSMVSRNGSSLSLSLPISLSLSTHIYIYIHSIPCTTQHGMA